MTAAGRGAERHAEADLARAERHQVRHHAVDAEAGEHQRQPRESASSTSASLRLATVCAMRVVERLRLEQREVRVHRPQRLAHDRRHRGRADVGAHEDVGERSPAAAAPEGSSPPRAACSGWCCGRPRRRRRSATARCPMPVISVRPTGSSPGKCLPGEGLVDDHHVRHARAVALVEVAAGADRDAERAEVSRRHEVTIRLRPLAHRRQRTAQTATGAGVCPPVSGTRSVSAADVLPGSAARR